MSWSTSELRVRLAPLNRFKPSSKIFYWLFQGGTSFVDLICFCSVLCLLCLCAHLFICALWSPAGQMPTSWLSFVVSNCEFVTFPLVSWVRCGTWLHRFLIIAPLLTLILNIDYYTLFAAKICILKTNITWFKWYTLQGYPHFSAYLRYCIPRRYSVVHSTFVYQPIFLRIRFLNSAHFST